MDLSVGPYHDDGTTWDAFVASHPGSTNYHRYGWRQVLEQSFGHQTLYLAARDSAGAICGILPTVLMRSRLFGTFLVSLPFFNYGGLLCNDRETETQLLLGCRTLQEQQAVAHVELRHLHRCDAITATKQHKVTMLLDLAETEQQQWQRFDPKVRNQIRKAWKSGLTAQAGHTELLDQFYRVFARNMRDLGTPVYAREFFANMLDSFPDSTRIIAVKQGDQTVAAAFLSWHRQTLEVPWAASIREFRPLCPNNLLYWEAIRFAINCGAQQFDFGRSTPGEGTFHFKQQWGAVPIPLYWQYLVPHGGQLPDLSPKNPKYRLAVQVWQRLPLLLTNLLGPHIVRCIP